MYVPFFFYNGRARIEYRIVPNRWLLFNGEADPQDVLRKWCTTRTKYDGVSRTCTYVDAFRYASRVRRVKEKEKEDVAEVPGG